MHVGEVVGFQELFSRGKQMRNALSKAQNIKVLLTWDFSVYKLL